jgi:hypothetical protein
LYNLLFAFLLSLPFSYFISAFLSNFYGTPYQIILITILSQTGFSILIRQIITAQSTQAEAIFKGILFGLLALATLNLFQIVNQFTTLYEAEMFQLEKNQTFGFIGAVTLSFPLLLWLKLKNNIYKSHEGILLASIFFVNYLLLVSIFNQPVFDVDDIFFDADGLLWRLRFTTENVTDYYFRPVHPFVLIIIRPLVWIFSIFTKGDALYATFILIACTGAVCVFFVWYFVKHVTKKSFYALLIASLFGASTAQLVFSAIIETYIFLGAIALLAILLLLKEKPLWMFIATGLIAFGITVSNAAQTVIAHLIIKRDIKQIIQYGLIALVLIAPLTLLNNFVYPNSQPYFWDLASYQTEDSNSFQPTLQRANYLGRVILLHSVVAPQPLILKEEIPFLKVWISRAAIDNAPMQLAQYKTPLANALAFTWLGLISLGGFLFLKNFSKSENRFALTFSLILLFNFFLHLQYGKDVFLYSANWTYALILFLALAWQELANKIWFQTALLTFIALVNINNAQLILTMLTTSAQHIK